MSAAMGQLPGEHAGEPPARLTLIALRAVLPPDEQAKLHTQTVVVNGIACDSDSEASAALSRLPEPKVCRATVVAGCLNVEAEVTADATILAMLHRSADMTRLHSSLGSTIREQIRLLARDHLSSVRVSPDEFERWERAYFIPDLALSVGQADESARALGMALEIKFWNGANALLLEMPIEQPAPTCDRCGQEEAVAQVWGRDRSSVSRVCRRCYEQVKYEEHLDDARAIREREIDFDAVRRILAGTDGAPPDPLRRMADALILVTRSGKSLPSDLLAFATKHGSSSVEAPPETNADSGHD